jgi:hypothetical protein
LTFISIPPTRYRFGFAGLWDYRLEFRVRAKLSDSLDEFLRLNGEFSSFRRGYPRKFQPTKIDPKESKFLAENRPSPLSVIISGVVMAVSDMASGNPDPIGSLFERLDNELEVDSSGAGDFNYTEIRRVQHAACSREIGAGICAPVAEKSECFWMKISHYISSLNNSNSRNLRVNLLLCDSSNTNAI